MLRNQIVRYIPAVLIAVGIAVLSLWEQPQIPPAFTISDKLAHGILYAVWAISMMVAADGNARIRVRTYLYVCVIATSYGALMEILQRYCTLTRSGEMADLYADAIGAIIGLILFGIIEISRSRHNER